MNKLPRSPVTGETALGVALLLVVEAATLAVALTCPWQWNLLWLALGAAAALALFLYAEALVPVVAARVLGLRQKLAARRTSGRE